MDNMYMKKMAHITGHPKNANQNNKILIFISEIGTIRMKKKSWHVCGRKETL